MSSNPRIPFQLSSMRARYMAPQGRPLIVNVVVNIEHWPFDRPMPRGILPAPHGVQPPPPDVPNFSWVEYGMRCGMPRLIEMLRGRGIPATTFFNAEVADVYPSLADAVLEAGWEFVGHGWFQRSLKQSEDEEAEVRRCVARLEALTGKKPRGWFGAGGGETSRTPDVLKACGIEFTHDWLVDDLPCWIDTAHGKLLSLPYTWELNDVPLWAIQSNPSDALLRRLEATLAVLGREAQQQPRIITFGLHPHIVGVPHRAHYMEQALDLLLARPDVCFMTSSGIADWYLEADQRTGL